MKIALIGYGKMGKAIETIALEKGHQVDIKLTSSSVFDELSFSRQDVAIEFTNPHACVANIEKSLKAGVPVVVGSTGWYAHFAEVEAMVKEHNGALLHATNFSVGVNLFFSFNAMIAKKMADYPAYILNVHEVHHTQKLDAPSGTAITTAETILKNYPSKTKWVHGHTQHADILEITHERTDNVPGTHVVTYSSDIDDIRIEHIAHNRKGFAGGAVLAAEWLKGKKGIFTMKDVLGIEY